ncbi:putative acetyltransferase [Marinobacter gudaonensis]|uniref:Putative acetyltransferase n=1 Tax=Marinobacter gudaonensis TaxID=375760 RepID=A0A1I6G788_9GAMM|nr:GNAT family N-acetyltransferase [Marinobacter gudaonensis]SFR37981.1 putative acetyltransferase [Marinobacter gudaonensis]
MNRTLSLRPATETDLPSIVSLFTDSVHQLAARSYTPEQRAAWAPEVPDEEQWRSRLTRVETLIAESDGTMAGFISFTAGGHIEFLFTAPAFSRRGVASLLYEAAVERLLAKGVRTLTTDASLEARPFFESRGFSVVEAQTVERDGVQLQRFAMARCLSQSE